MINVLTPMMLSWWYPNSHDIPMIFELNPPVVPVQPDHPQGFLQSRCQRLGLHRLWRHRHLCPYQGWWLVTHGPSMGPWRDLGNSLFEKKGMVLDDVHSWRYFKIHNWCWTWAVFSTIQSWGFTSKSVDAAEKVGRDVLCLIFDDLYDLSSSGSSPFWLDTQIQISTPAKLFVLFDFQNTSKHSSCFQWFNRLCHHLWDGETKNGKSYGIWWSSTRKHKKHLETRIAWEISSQPAETSWASTWNSALEPEHQRS